MNSDKDGPPPLKRRRISERAPRTTEYLDLRRDAIDADEQPQLDRLLNVLHKRQKIVVVAGAGISVSAGSGCSCSEQLRRRVLLTTQQFLISARPLVYSPL